MHEQPRERGADRHGREPGRERRVAPSASAASRSTRRREAERAQHASSRARSSSIASSALKMPRNATTPASTRSTSVIWNVRSNTASDSSCSRTLDRTRASAPDELRERPLRRAPSPRLSARSTPTPVSPSSRQSRRYRVERHHDRRSRPVLKSRNAPTIGSRCKPVGVGSSSSSPTRSCARTTTAPTRRHRCLFRRHRARRPRRPRRSPAPSRARRAARRAPPRRRDGRNRRALA